MARSEKTRQFIIEKTATIFNKKGYTGTYLSDLTEATGLTKGSIYGNFLDKNEVAIEAFRYNYNGIATSIRDYINQGENTVEQLLGFIRFYEAEYLHIFSNGGCAVLNTAVDADDGNPQLKHEVCKALERWRNKIVSLINEGIEKNELNSIDANEFADYMISLIEGTIMLAKVTQNYKALQNNLQKLNSEIRALARI